MSEFRFQDRFRHFLSLNFDTEFGSKTRLESRVSVFRFRDKTTGNLWYWYQILCIADVWNRSKGSLYLCHRLLYSFPINSTTADRAGPESIFGQKSTQKSSFALRWSAIKDDIKDLTTAATSLSSHCKQKDVKSRRRQRRWSKYLKHWFHYLSFCYLQKQWGQADITDVLQL